MVGRQRELDVLTDWVSNPGTDVYRARVLVLLALGGMGKSAVAWKWFNDIAPQELLTLSGRVWCSFYEIDARFDNFVLRTLGYVTGQPVEELQKRRAPEREEELLGILDREPYLVVLDGVERLLLAYSRSDASRLADDDLDEQTAHQVAGAMGLPPSAAASFTGQSRLRNTVDPRTGVFLRRLAGLRASRVLITSRLFPADLQTVTTEPVPGAYAYFLGGLTDTDAVALWRAWGITGSRAELIELFAAFGNYPLLIRALVGEVALFHQAPRNFAAWRQANPGFDPFSLPLVQRQAHVLAYALGGLTEPELRVLHTVAAFRSSTVFPTLAALLVGDDRPCATQADLGRVLTDLEDRGLLGWDRASNHYDLHPVVRGVAWSSLDPDTRYGIDLRLVRHLGETPEVNDTAVTCVDDLSSTIELYHMLVRLGRLNDAIELLNDRIFEVLARLGDFRYLAELARIVIEDPDWLQRIASEGDLRDAAIVCGIMGIGYQFAGDPVRALDSYGLISSEQLDGDLVVAKLLLQSMALDQRGCLAEAERCARAALAQPDLDGDIAGDAMTALGSVLLHRGFLKDGAAWLADYRTTLGRSPFGELSLGYLSLRELGWDALHRDDVLAAEVFANRLDNHAATSNRKVYLGVCAMVLRGVVAGRWGDEDRAGELLSGGLADARETGLGELEIVGLTQLAEWHLRGCRLSEARDHARDAVELAERAELRLRLADALNVLSRVERKAGNTEAAARAAHAAYLQAWCDGPPFSYQAGMAEARANLKEVGAPELAGLDGVELGEPFPEVLIKPARPVSLASILAGVELPQSHVIAAIERLGWAAVDPVATAELDAILGSGVAAPIRTAALRALARIETDNERRRERVQRAARDRADEVRAAALPLLDHQTDPQVATVFRALAERDPAPMVRLAALPLLAERDSDDAFTMMNRIAGHDGDPDVRVGALTALAGVRDGIIRVRPALLHAVVADPTGWVRVHAAQLITGLEPRTHDALLLRGAREDPDPRVRERLLMLLAGARGTWLWRWQWLILSGATVPRAAATIELGVGVKSFLEEHASADPSVLVRVAVRLLTVASHPVSPEALLLGEFLAAPASDHVELGIALMAAGGLGRDPAVFARLSELLESEESEELRLMLAGGLCRAGHVDSEPVLRTLLHAADSDIRRGALLVLSWDLERPDQRLLTRDVDWTSPLLDPMESITATRIAHVAEQIGKSIDEVRRDYARLAAIFDLGDWIRD
ncbi:MAG: HEAT repeat domain-containing protein [Pseudonocardiaceae bacterium]